MSELIDSSLPKHPTKGNRSLFLSVLCVLTWVGSVWYFLLAIYGMITLESSVNAIRALYSFVDETPILPNYLPEYVSEMMENVDRYIYFTRIHQFIAMINAAFCFWGAILIWRRKRTGFYMYLLAQIPYFISGILVYWAGNEIPLIGTFSGIITMFSLIMVVIFSFMYTFRFKNLIE
jgi:hypothetical protein